MPRLDIIVQNPAAADALVWSDVIVLGLLTALIVALWVVVARGRARRDIQDFDESASDRGLEALRHRRLVVRRPRMPRGPQAPVVSELERTEEPGPPEIKSSG